MNENKPPVTWKWALGSVNEKKLVRRKGWKQLDQSEPPTKTCAPNQPGYGTSCK